MYMTRVFCRFYFFNMSKICIRNLSSSKIVQNLLQSFVFKTSEFEGCEQSLFCSKIGEGSGICDYSSGDAREPRAACRAGALLRGQIVKYKYMTKKTDCLCRYIEVLFHVQWNLKITGIK